MKALLFIFLRVWGGQWRAFGLGLVLSVTVLCAGIALLALSGWFITAAGLAGITGLGVTFDVFRPSAGVRLFAFGRAAARYGERLTTHNATLKGLARLRTLLTAAFLRMPIRQLQRLRGSERLNLMTVDVDSLDGLALRLVLPLAAALATLLVTALIFIRLTTIEIVTWQILSLVIGVVAAGLLSYGRSRKPSRRARHAMQALRTRIIEMRRGQVELTMAGALQSSRDAVMAAQDRLQTAQAGLEATARISNFAMMSASTIAAAGALCLGAIAYTHQVLDAASAAMGFFASLALMEVGAPLVRGVAEIGQMRDAARRIRPVFDPPSTPDVMPLERSCGLAGAAVLSIDTVTVSVAGRVILDRLSLDVQAGETVAIVGESGKGKSTLLQLARGLLNPDGGHVLVGGQDVNILDRAEQARRIGYLPQRTSLLRGTIRDNLRLARSDASEDDMMAALQCAELAHVVEGKGGLDARLGEAGSGLSGGEHRRLALSRVMLLTPALLLLDEPTEGLDDETAARILRNIRAAHPAAAILIAAHKPLEMAWAGRIVALS